MAEDLLQVDGEEAHGHELPELFGLAEVLRMRILQISSHLHQAEKRQKAVARRAGASRCARADVVVFASRMSELICNMCWTGSRVMALACSRSA